MDRFIMGSTYFFSNYSDFVSKDLDELVLTNDCRYKCANIRGRGKDIFYWRRMPKSEWIDIHLKFGENDPMIVGKFLIAEFNKEIRFTIDDLKKFEQIFNKMDEKHMYEKIIYDSYIENGDFYLTDLQRDKAYKEYKKYRNEVIR